MSSTVEICYEIILAYSDLKKHSIRGVAEKINVNKDAVARHMGELERLGLARIDDNGRNGGACLLRPVLINNVLVSDSDLQDIVDGLRLLEQSRGVSKAELIARLPNQKKEAL